MPLRVLIVNDDPSLRRALTKVLRAFDPVTAASATAALVALEAHAFDAILTDFGIPPFDGVALLRRVEASHAKTRRYLMTGFDVARFEEHVTSQLIRRVFAKPLDLDALRAELASSEAP